MQMMRTAGMLVPKVLCYGEHPNAPCNRTFSILTTRLLGSPPENTAETLLIDSEDLWFS
jgi:hypothetical protein